MGGPNSQQAHDVVTTSMRRNDVALTSFRRLVPIRFLITQCQIITFLILKYDIIENSRIELRGIVLPVQMGGLLGGQRVCWPPLSNYWGAWPPPGPPSSYAYVIKAQRLTAINVGLASRIIQTDPVLLYNIQIELERPFIFFQTSCFPYLYLAI